MALAAKREKMIKMAAQIVKRRRFFPRQKWPVEI